MVRRGEVIAIKPECVDAYVEYHRNVWPEVSKMISECNIRNYSIFLREGLMFAYYEYVGTDFDADMAKMAADPNTQKWWVRRQTAAEPSGVAEREGMVGLDGRGFPSGLTWRRQRATSESKEEIKCSKRA